MRFVYIFFHYAGVSIVEELEERSSCMAWFGLAIVRCLLGSGCLMYSSGIFLGNFYLMRRPVSSPSPLQSLPHHDATDPSSGFSLQSKHKLTLSLVTAVQAYHTTPPSPKPTKLTWQYIAQKMIHTHCYITPPHPPSHHLHRHPDIPGPITCQHRQCRVMSFPLPPLHQQQHVHPPRETPHRTGNGR